MKKTKIYVEQTELVSRIEEIVNKLKSDNRFLSWTYEEILRSKMSKETDNQIYKLISEVLKKEYGGDVASNTTIWRILKIKNESSELYKKVREGKIGIRTAFNSLRQPVDSEGENHKTYTINGNLNFDEIYEYLKELDTELSRYEYSYKNGPFIQRLKDIDTEIFNVRKRVGKLIIESDPDRY